MNDPWSGHVNTHLTQCIPPIGNFNHLSFLHCCKRNFFYRLVVFLSCFVLLNCLLLHVALPLARWKSVVITTMPVGN